MRVKPRWSFVSGLPQGSTARSSLPALMTGLPYFGGQVWVGPP